MENTVDTLRSRSGFDLPEAYLNFLCIKAPVESYFQVEPYRCYIWSGDEVLQANLDYKIKEFMPAFFAFGTSGGGELFVLDSRTWKIYSVAVNALDEPEAIKIAEDFESFIEILKE
jgi:hypothetical protein